MMVWWFVFATYVGVIACFNCGYLLVVILFIDLFVFVVLVVLDGLVYCYLCVRLEF